MEKDKKNENFLHKVTWRSPSNIALIKYWGKHGLQLPSNPSLSFSLSAAYTETKIQCASAENPENPEIQFFFERKENPAFAERIRKYINSIGDYLPQTQKCDLIIHSKNSFPHSSGIASSASAFSALALGLYNLEQQLQAKSLYDDQFFRKASLLARLGSGSAARSVYPAYAVWGKNSFLKAASDDYAISFDDYHDTFKNFKDAILIVSAEQKSVKSSAGHELMKAHPYANSRFHQANENLGLIIDAMKKGDMEKFIDITENEALSLHAMMMTSRPSFMLLQPNSLIIMEKIRGFRKQNDVKLCFSIDAGPNIHLLYPEAEERRVKDFIENDLLVYCASNKWIDDGMGNGPEKLI